MNLNFLRSGHALIAVAVVVGFAAWHYVAPQRFGDRSDENVLFLLATGWVAVASYVALALYAARRAAHRLRLTPEFGWEAKLPQLEQAQTQLRELENAIERREVLGRSAVRGCTARRSRPRPPAASACCAWTCSRATRWARWRAGSPPTSGTGSRQRCWSGSTAAAAAARRWACS